MHCDLRQRLAFALEGRGWLSASRKSPAAEQMTRARSASCIAGACSHCSARLASPDCATGPCRRALLFQKWNEGSHDDS